MPAYSIELPVAPFAGKAAVLGHKVPSSRLWEAMFDGASQDELEALALDACVYRTQEKQVTVVSYREPQEGDEVLASVDVPQGMGSRTAYIVRRVEEMRIRPWMMGQLVRFEYDPDQTSLLALFAILKREGRAPVAMVDRKIFHVPADRVPEVFERFGITDAVESNAHLLVRVGVLMKRPGGLPVSLALPGGRFSEAQNDGTIAITREVTGPMPGTMRINKRIYLKGMVRPPLLIEGKVEDQAVVKEAQFGNRIPMPVDITSVEFQPVRTLPHERPSLNYQALMFAAVHPEKVIRRDNERLKALKIEDLLTKEQQAKVRAGVPPAMFMTELAPWKWLRQFDLGRHAARATVFASTLVPVGSCAMLPGTFARFSWIERDEDGGEELVWHPQVVLHRDPAVPDASSMSVYTLQGEAVWDVEGASQEDEGIVLNPLDPRWKRAAGDFDGDAATIFVPSFDLKDMLPNLPALKQKRGMPVTKFAGRPSLAATMVTMATGVTGLLGPAVLTSMRIAERGCLTKDVAMLTAQVVQGSIDAKKHPVDYKAVGAGFAQLRACEEKVRPAAGFLIDRMRAVTSAVGNDARVAAWQELVEHCEGRTDMNAVEAAMVERVKLLTEIFTKTQWIRGDRVTLPETMRQTALAWLLEQSDDPAAAAAKVQQLSWAYRKAGQDLANAKAAGQDDAAHEAGERLREARLKIRLALHHGEISEAALVAKGPGKLAAEFCSAATFAELGHTARFLETVLFGTQWVDGPLEVSKLDPIPSCRKQVETTLGTQMVSEVQVKVLGGNERTRRVVLTW